MTTPNVRSNLQLESLITAKLAVHQRVSEPLARPAHYAITVLAYARISLEAGCLLVPGFTFRSFRFVTTTKTATVVRLFGVRGIAVSELLVTTDEKERTHDTAASKHRMRFDRHI
jgi:hypothetical protein